MYHQSTKNARELEKAAAELNMQMHLRSTSPILSVHPHLLDSELIAMLKPLDQHFWPAERSDLMLFGKRKVGRFTKLLYRGYRGIPRFEASRFSGEDS